MLQSKTYIRDRIDSSVMNQLNCFQKTRHLKRKRKFYSSITISWLKITTNLCDRRVRKSGQPRLVEIYSSVDQRRQAASIISIRTKALEPMLFKSTVMRKLVKHAFIRHLRTVRSRLLTVITAIDQVINGSVKCHKASR